LYINYYKAVASGARIPEDNEWDLSRQAYDAKLYPYFFQEITFAALTLNNCGVTGYGDYCMVLKSNLIASRASVIETNSFIFVKEQLHHGDVDPAGHRSSWDQRAKLVMAKLAGTLKFSTTDSSFPSLLLGTDDRGGDFIEVHIYGEIHRRAIERVVCRSRPLRRQDALLNKRLIAKLQEFGAAFEESA
jgi:hypothetical protein